jgi:hypothetical protein
VPSARFRGARIIQGRDARSTWQAHGHLLIEKGKGSAISVATTEIEFGNRVQITVA